MKSTSIIDAICLGSAFMKEILTIAKEFDKECTFAYVLDVLLLEVRGWMPTLNGSSHSYLDDGSCEGENWNLYHWRSNYKYDSVY